MEVKSIGRDTSSPYIYEVSSRYYTWTECLGMSGECGSPRLISKSSPHLDMVSRQREEFFLVWFLISQVEGVLLPLLAEAVTAFLFQLVSYFIYKLFFIK